MAKRAHRWAFLLVLLAGLAAACGGTAPSVRAPAKGLLLLQCEVPDAEIWLDSRYLREVVEVKGGIRLGPGIHRIEVRHPEYHSRYFEVELATGERRRLDVDLARRLP